MFNKFLNLFAAPESFTQLMYKIGWLILGTMIVMLLIKFIDGPNHRLGIIHYDPKTHEVWYD